MRADGACGSRRRGIVSAPCPGSSTPSTALACPGASSGGSPCGVARAEPPRRRRRPRDPSVRRPPTMSQSSAPKTLYDKIWDAHLVHEAEDGTSVLYIDMHLVHEVTSPQAFEGLRLAGRQVRRPDATVAVPDHNVPTDVDRAKGIENEESRIQVEALQKNARDFGVELYDVSDVRQ